MGGEGRHWTGEASPTKPTYPGGNDEQNGARWMHRGAPGLGWRGARRSCRNCKKEMVG